jgi:hypothetical protein
MNFAMGFSVFVESVNIRVRAPKPTSPLHLRRRYLAGSSKEKK